MKNSLLLQGVMAAASFLPTESFGEPPKPSSSVLREQEREQQEIQRILQSSPAERAKIARKIQEQTPDTYEAYVSCFSHGLSEVRDWATNKIVEKATKEMEQTRKPFQRDQLRMDNANNVHIAETKSRLVRALQRIRQEEIRISMETASSFDAPATWEQVGHEESLGTVLRTLSGFTGQPIALQSTQEDFLDFPTPTQGLRESYYWSALLKLRTKYGNSLASNANRNGAHFVHEDHYDHCRHWQARGAMCAFMKPSKINPGSVSFSIDTEPKLQPTSWSIRTVTITDENGESTVLSPSETSTKFGYVMSVQLPRAAEKGKKVSLQLDATICASPTRVFQIENTAKPQSFTYECFGKKCTINYRPMKKVGDEFEIAFQIDPPKFDSHLLSQFGCFFLDENNVTIIQKKNEEQPTVENNAIWTLHTKSKPHIIRILAPSQEIGRSNPTFTFPDVELSTDPPIQ